MQHSLSLSLSRFQFVINNVTYIVLISPRSPLHIISPIYATYIKPSKFPISAQFKLKIKHTSFTTTTKIKIQSSTMHPQFLLVAFPIQGQINPTLHFAKRLLRIGVHVTFMTTTSIIRRMSKSSTTPKGITYAEFSDGYDDGFKSSDGNSDHYVSEVRRCGSEALSKILVERANEGRPFSCVVYTTILPWAAKVAHELHVPSALLWIQPATILDMYYYYFKGYGDVITKYGNDPSWSIELPGLPRCTGRDLPSFFVGTTNADSYALPSYKEHIEILDDEGANSKVLVNTFDELESDALKAVSKLNLIAIGPLIPSAFLDGKDPSDTSSGVDLFHGSKDYIEWLNSKPKSSVIYVSFGSLAVLSKPQTEEIARGLLESGRPFLWVIRETPKNGDEVEENEEKKVSYIEELEEKGLGMIVAWCSQVEVLSHPSLGCFVTHCGWNSTLESLISGVTVVAFPQWADQKTNAKLIEDVWKTGVRVTENEEGIVEGGEIERCLEIVMGGGERGEEMRRNAKKWKDLGREAAKEGGCSDRNLRAFVDGASSEV